MPFERIAKLGVIFRLIVYSLTNKKGPLGQEPFRGSRCENRIITFLVSTRYRDRYEASGGCVRRYCVGDLRLRR